MYPRLVVGMVSERRRWEFTGKLGLATGLLLFDTHIWSSLSRLEIIFDENMLKYDGGIQNGMMHGQGRASYVNIEAS